MQDPLHCCPIMIFCGVGTKRATQLTANTISGLVLVDIMQKASNYCLVCLLIVHIFWVITRNKLNITGKPTGMHIKRMEDFVNVRMADQSRSSHQVGPESLLHLESDVTVPNPSSQISDSIQVSN